MAKTSRTIQRHLQSRGRPDVDCFALKMPAEFLWVGHASGSAGVPPEPSNVERTPKRDKPSASARNSTPDGPRETRGPAGGTPALPDARLPVRLALKVIWTRKKSRLGWRANHPRSGDCGLGAEWKRFRDGSRECRFRGRSPDRVWIIGSGSGASSSRALRRIRPAGAARIPEWRRRRRTSPARTCP